MAWRSSGRSHAELIANLQANRLLQSPTLTRCLLATDRRHYVSPDRSPYEDAPQHIAGTEATTSAPHMHVLALEMLELDELLHKQGSQLQDQGVRVLDVGCGSGYLLAALHRYLQVQLPAAAAARSTVVGIDYIPELTRFARKNLEADGLGEALASGRIVVQTGDGKQGSAAYAPFHAIHVGAAAQDGVPAALLSQLHAPGRLVLPVGAQGGEQVMTIVEKDLEGQVTMEKRFGVRYVPLC